MSCSTVSLFFKYNLYIFEYFKFNKSDNSRIEYFLLFSLQTNSPSAMKLYEVENLEEQNDGNNVSLDKQISEMSKNAVMNDAIANSIKRDSRWFKMMVDAAGKN